MNKKIELKGRILIGFMENLPFNSFLIGLLFDSDTSYNKPIIINVVIGI